ncbi:hypothetical protein [Nonomuraea basaltis]|nr:hypothetical protein [Nonomuraea basaltis]
MHRPQLAEPARSAQPPGELIDMLGTAVSGSISSSRRKVSHSFRS